MTHCCSHNSLWFTSLITHYCAVRQNGNSLIYTLRLKKTNKSHFRQGLHLSYAPLIFRTYFSLWIHTLSEELFNIFYLYRLTWHALPVLQIIYGSFESFKKWSLLRFCACVCSWMLFRCLIHDILVNYLGWWKTLSQIILTKEVNLSCCLTHSTAMALIMLIRHVENESWLLKYFY